MIAVQGTKTIMRLTVCAFALCLSCGLASAQMVRSDSLGQDPANALYRLGGALGAPRSLRDLGMPSSGIERAAEAALANPYWNPQSLRLDTIRALLFRAWAGEPPEPPAVA